MEKSMKLEWIVKQQRHGSPYHYLKAGKVIVGYINPYSVMSGNDREKPCRWFTQLPGYWRDAEWCFKDLDEAKVFAESQVKRWFKLANEN
jgi:hypothetical protein